MVYVGTCDCYENIKIKLWSTISILEPWRVRIFRYKRKMILKLTTFCKMFHACKILHARLVTWHFIMSRSISGKPARNIISWKGSVPSVNGAGGSDPLRRGLRRRSPLRKSWGSKEYLEWLNDTGKTLFHSIQCKNFLK